MYIFLIISLSFLIRLYHHQHILMSDEANNMLTIKAIIEGDGLRQYFFKHPPLFTLVSSAISYPFGDNHYIVQCISIAFSVFSMVPLYLIVEKVFDKRTALLSLLVLAVLPLNTAYSTWVKQDAMLLFLFTLSMYLYITERPIASGIMLGLASLTKEFAWFLIPIVAGWELLMHTRPQVALKRFLAWLIIGVMISIWWYFIYGGMSFRAIGAVAGGGDVFEFSWHYPWYYYLRNLRADISLVLYPFLIIGLFISGRQKPFPVLWILAFYLPLSLMKVKAPWYTYLASPALSMVIAVGFIKIWDVGREGWIRWGMASTVLALTAINIYSFNGTGYYEWLVARELPRYESKEYMTEGREVLRTDGRVAMLEYNPTLQYYLGIPDKRLFYLGSQFPAMDKEKLVALTERNGIGWFVIDRESTNYIERNLSDLSYLYGEPKEVGNVLIFKVSKGNIP